MSLNAKYCYFSMGFATDARKYMQSMGNNMGKNAHL
jgi:hypothetical protein